MNSYASGTSVSVEKSRGEIESTLRRFGASSFAYATDNTKAMVRFLAAERQIMFVLDLPNPADFKFRTYNGRTTGKARAASEVDRLWEQSCRQKWRALALSIKARLVSVDDGISTFEDAFMAHIVLPGGKTVSQHMKPQIATAYQTGKMPPLLELK